jgi:hypothetical protein
MSYRSRNRITGFTYAWYQELTPYVEEGYDQSKYLIDQVVLEPVSFIVTVPAKSSVERSFPH